MRPPRWKSYTPQLDVWNGGTTPNLGTGAEQRGRYLWIPELQLCHCNFRLTFGSGGSGGSGNYMVSLPVPAQPSLGFDNSQNDRMLGYASAGRIFQSSTVPIVPTVSDHGPSNINGQHRSQWAQLFVPWQRDSGSSAVTSTNTTVAVTFAVTALGPPSAADIVITPTNGSTNLVSQWWVTSITTGGFTLHVNTDPGTSGFHFDWKLKLDAPSACVTDQAPWAWGSSGDVINGGLSYETV